MLVSLWKLVFSAFYLVHLGFHSVQISFQSSTLASLLLGLVVDVEIAVSVVIRVQLGFNRYAISPVSLDGAGSL